MDFYAEAFRAALLLLRDFNPDVRDALFRSLRIATIATFFAALSGIPVGGLIALNSFRGKRIVISTFSTLMAVPTVVVGLLLYGLYTRRGLLGHLDLLYSETAIISAEFVLTFPVIVRLTIAALGSVDPRVGQTALTLGANRVQALALYLREALTGIAAATIVGYGRAISEVGAAMIVGGNIRGQTRTLTTAIALESSRGEFALGLALGGLLLGVFLIINVALLRVQDSS
ncbi:MAG: ABC transporter permease [Trueperaceae bacterium]|nr:ABC transporter permease [Trueperaceae bacterium]